MARKVFISHSRYDTQLLPWFEDVFDAANVDRILVEVEKPLHPTRYILEKVQQSEAVFVLLSEHIMKSPYTHSWIVSEVMIGFMREIPVLVFIESGVSVNIPLPYLDFYSRISLTDDNFDTVLELVESGSYSAYFENLPSITCPYSDCRSPFRTLNPINSVEICPTCLGELHLQT